MSNDHITNLRHIRNLLSDQRKQIIKRKNISEADRKLCLETNGSYIVTINAAINVMQEKQHEESQA